MMINLTSAPQSYVETPVGQKSAGIAVLLALIIPGSGQMYAERILRGIIVLIITLLFLAYFIGFIAWVYGMVDAYRLAKKWNRELQSNPYARPW